MRRVNVSNVTDIAPNDPYKDIQFEYFLKSIGNFNFRNWSILARALRVDRRTIMRWKKHPLARQAIVIAICECIRKMQEVGAHDWKMYREMLKILAI